MNTRSIPKTHPELLSLGVLALAGAEALGEEVGLMQNTPDRIRADLQALTGEAEPDAPSSTQGALNAERAELSRLRVTRRQAMKAGREFCAAAIDWLKLHLGRRWNPRWVAAGFGTGTLAIPYDPLSMLIDLRNYLRAHPEHALASPELTAARAEVLIGDLETANDAVTAGSVRRRVARRNRDGAVQALARRLRGLRNELEQLLSRDDVRWHRYGFRRPIERRQPGSVEELALEPGPPGEVRLTWVPAPRAVNYRVRWWLKTSADEVTELPLLRDPRTQLRGLPAGEEIVCEVSARNAAGESLPTRVSGIVPTAAPGTETAAA